LVTWAVPFVISLVCYGRDGQLQIPIGTFKSIMFISGSATAMGMLALLYRRGPPLAGAGWIVGGAWLAINIVLDLVVLVGGLGMAPSTYFATVGLGYLTIPIITLGVDWISRAGMH